MARRIMRRFALSEISAVDNPANAHARMKIFKREDTDMPWTASDAQGHSKKADTPEKQKRWATIANAALEDKGDEGYAIRVANAAIGKAADEVIDGVKVADLIAKYDEPYWKREFTAEQRRSDAESGDAEPDGSYPIKDAKDLHNAMQAVGRSKNPAKTKAHIRARAKALGLESELSDAFKRNGVVTKIVDAFWTGRLEKARAALTKSLQSIVDDDDAGDKAALVDKSVDEFTAHMAALSEDLTKALSGGDPDVPEEIDMSLELKKALGLPADATADQITAAVEKLTGTVEKAKDDEIAKLRKESDALKIALAKAEMDDAEKAHHDGMKDETEKEKFRAAGKDRRKEMMGKRSGADSLVESLELEKANSKLKEYEKRMAALEEERDLEKYTKRVVAMGLPESKGKQFMLMCKNATTPEQKAAVEEFEKDMTSAIAAAKEGGVFKEFGAAGRTEVLTPYEELVAKAAELRKTQPQLTEAQAFAKVYADPANKKIVQAERAGKFSGDNEAA